MFGLAFPVTAEVSLPAIIGSNMALQADKPVPIWGRAEPQETVRVHFRDREYLTVANADGAWEVTLPAMTADGNGAELKVVGETNELILTNVIVGEVWLCSGQSNMGWRVEQSDDAEREIAAAQYPSIRLFTVKRAIAEDGPQWDCAGEWVECSPATVGKFSAAGYFMGRDLHQTLERPVGLIHSSWGGTKAKVWLPREAIDSRPELQVIAEAWDRELADYPRAKAEFDAALPQMEAEWEERATAARAAGKAPPATPRLRTGPHSQYVPTALYNAMIAPLAPFALRGFFWYQGESDVGAPQLYAETLVALVQSWRAAWRGQTMPFVCVQLPNLYRQPEPTRSGWPELREAQLKLRQLPGTALVVTIDIGEPGDIHPTQKQPVGRRAALAAQGLAYGADPAEVFSPQPTATIRRDQAVRIEFKHTAGGLRVSGSGAVTGFEVADADRVFRPGRARIEGDAVIVSHPDMTDPVAVRYAWADNPECNLVSGSGLPATPFRTDDWSTLATVAHELR
ncbi:sialate O-acetylesterase [Synoicihabitans lomoniglobus]|uniref:Sialate O-acetylesterase n=1 Tax=Synoicihabitans lomoniglobus TaxID=2909285 RepID=A0AAF0CSI8_9BACT|nr:sialate O-acetylesterase [Opitutaceae bacterium LMO-M01]WED67221.1 sialate O-acetylesterase [Opitutaceae bacterium LMO-M01]